MAYLRAGVGMHGELMIVYHSNLISNVREEHLKLFRGHTIRILKSYYDDKRFSVPSFVSGVFLDSGAFNAYRTGAVIDLDEYACFLKMNGNHYDAYASLDVIGDLNATLKNQRLLDSYGLLAIPTFHVGEPLKQLEQYIEKYSYLALGGMVPISRSVGLEIWLSRCWKILERSEVKVHGFGMSDVSLFGYPWYSVDSRTASLAGRMGEIISPWGRLKVSLGKAKLAVSNPLEKGRILDWLFSFLPGLVQNWDDIGAITPEASVRRIIINAMYLDKLSVTKINRPKVQNGFGL